MKEEKLEKQEQDQEQEKMIVHILHNGQTLCAGMPGPPSSWPQGHAWVTLHDAFDASCQGCIDGMDRLR